MKNILVTAFFLGMFSLGYAQSDYYNDYRRSITDLNWQNVAVELILSTTQKNQLYALNDRYNDYNSWDKKYSKNPDKWRTDRYAEIEKILGKEKYKQFKNKYYQGQNPTAVYNRNKNNDVKSKQKVSKKQEPMHDRGHDNRR
ncbi:hypothetical protein [Chryseobacterium sp.]|uniref:hypothetical protein n=1 Tax=Chryseobacterium sp. TaxID=1871047 RepID=UPI0025BF41EA|nr:hypothetical protein [Chryseobacterium sp.]